MSSKFPIFFGIAILLVGFAVWFGYSSTSDSRLELTGEILKVRTLSLTPDSTLLLLDFRMKNESTVTFLLKDAIVVWTRADGTKSEADPVSRPDLDRIFAYAKEAGPKYNELFVMREKLAGKAMLDRMAAGVVQVSEAEFEKRKDLHLRLTDMDGKTFEFRERKLH